MNVSHQRTDARHEFVMLDLRLFQGELDARQGVVGIIRAHDAGHSQVRVPPQEVSQKKAPEETGRSGQQDLPEVLGTDRGARPGTAGRLVDESAQRIDIVPALRWQGPRERRDLPAQSVRFRHVPHRRRGPRFHRQPAGFRRSRGPGGPRDPVRAGRPQGLPRCRRRRNGIPPGWPSSGRWPG